MLSFTIKPTPSVKELRIWLLKISFGVLFVVFGILGVFSNVFGNSTIFEDDFNSYDDGDLNSQGDWSGSTGFDVQGIIVKEGAKAVETHFTGAGESGTIVKTGNQLSKGEIAFYLRVSSVTKGTTVVNLQENGTRTAGVGAVTDQSASYWSWVDSVGWHISTVPYSIDTWHLVEIEWQETGGTNPQFRWRIDEGTWQGWYDCNNDWITGINQVQLYGAYFDSGKYGYIDYIAEYPYSPFSPHLSGTMTEGVIANYDEIPYPTHDEYTWCQGEYPDCDTSCSWGESGTTTQAICNNATTNLEIRLQATACEGNGQYFDRIFLDSIEVGYFTYERKSATDWRFTPYCSIDSCEWCEHWFECQVVGCCWYYQPWYAPPFDNYCDVCEGECSYPYNCGLCTTEATCEAQGCFWTGDYCTQFEWECGGELACQFCDTQETCEAEECNWNAPTETCWYAIPTLPSSWSAYYDLHGGYATSSEFVNELAETTGETFIIVSGLFEGFITSFNTADALAKGSAMGNVIPKGRGYLKIFDGLFGHYPIGETFVFILIFMLAIGLFRIARQLIQLVKP